MYFLIMLSRPYHRKLAILVESFQHYIHSRKWILLSCCIFAFGYLIFAYYEVAVSRRRNVQGQEAVPHGPNAITKLEDSLSSANKLIEQFNNEITGLLEKSNSAEKRPVQKVMDAQKNLSIQKLKTILNYAKIPIGQFNQVPTFAIDDTSLEELVILYNDLQLAFVQRQNQADKEQNSDLTSELKKSQAAIINKIGQLISLLQNQHSKEKPNTEKLLTKKELNNLFIKRDSVMGAYTQLLFNYQYLLDSLPSLNTYIIQASYRPTQISHHVQKVSPSLKGHILLLASLFFLATFIPLAIIYYKKHQSPYVNRLHDINYQGDINNSLQLTLSLQTPHHNIQPDLDALKKIISTFKKPLAQLIAIYAVNGSDGKTIVADGLTNQLIQAGHSVIMIHLERSSPTKSGTIKPNYSLIDYVEMPALQIQDLLSPDPLSPLLKNIYLGEIDAILPKEEKTSHSQQLFWALQRLLIKHRVKQLLQSLKDQYDYVVVETPSLLALDFSLLFIPHKNISINVFQYHTTDRQLASELCRLTGNEHTPTISILNDTKLQ